MKEIEKELYESMLNKIKQLNEYYTYECWNGFKNFRLSEIQENLEELIKGEKNV